MNDTETCCHPNISSSDKNNDSDVDALVKASQEKLQDVGNSLSRWIPKALLGPQTYYCVCESVQDTVGYRCRCAFQCIYIQDEKKEQTSIFHYAIRQQQQPIRINDFPIANKTIQHAMISFRKLLNSNLKDYEMNECPIRLLRENLTSISFASSWCESDDLKVGDCLVTLHYDKPIQDETSWKAEARNVCLSLGFTQLTGRSRKCMVRALPNVEPILRDTLWLYKDNGQWKVSLIYPLIVSQKSDKGASIQSVHYEKPEGAFYHPNARVMCRALEWMLARLSTVAIETTTLSNRKPRLLELYCGCGAHTVALRKSALLDFIVAVEYDDRLVQACQRNCDLNSTTSQSSVDDCEPITNVEIVLADVAVWIRRDFVKKWKNNLFDVLLVDPPRQGLDPIVCRMACEGSFRHLFYISCGRDALLRDLDRLDNAFEVVDFALLDLFPQTNSVETLLHLRKKKARAD